MSLIALKGLALLSFSKERNDTLMSATVSKLACLAVEDRDKSSPSPLVWYNGGTCCYVGEVLIFHGKAGHTMTDILERRKSIL